MDLLGDLFHGARAIDDGDAILRDVPLQFLVEYTQCAQHLVLLVELRGVAACFAAAGGDLGGDVEDDGEIRSARVAG